MANLYRLLLGLVLGVLAITPTWGQVSTQLGVYYFPGWKNDAPHAPSERPWDRIQRFREREPMLGWYDEGADDVMQQHIDWMADYGLNYVVFDWYWDDANKVRLDHALGAYLRAPNRTRLPFSIMWANHGKAPSSQANWDRMVDFWIRFYASRPEMLRVDGKPVIFIFLSRDLDDKASKFGSSTAALLAQAQAKARQAGLPGLYFVAGASGAELPILKEASRIGYSAVTMYNLHAAPFKAQASHSYEELDAAYRGHWRSYESASSVPIIFPITSGWDKRPWGGSEDPKHDMSTPMPFEFQTHLEAAKSAMDAGKLRPGQASRWGLICCWNEFGEGSFIEPTRSDGFAMIDKVRRVFGAGKTKSVKE